jgi:signal transduction histidine kinase
MTGVSIGLDRAQNLTELNEHPGAAVLHERVGELRDLTTEMIKAVRCVTLELCAPELDDMGVQSAIQTYVREWVRVLSRRTKPESLKDLDCARAPKSSATSTRRGCSTNRAESLAARLPEGKHRCSLLP